MNALLNLARTLLPLLCVTGCSLISLKSPERPLSTRDLNARILTREFSVHFIALVDKCADEISARDADPNVRLNALRWKIGATAESQRAATRMAPMTGLLDTWALAAQMQAFLSPGGPGGAVFGTQQQAARTVANELNADADRLAHRIVAPQDFERYQKFVQTYTREHPLENLQFMRVSVVELWSQQSGVNVKLVDSLGTIPEAMADFSDRFQMYGNTIPSETMWRTQLALRESGYSGADLQSALNQIDARLAEMSAAADNAQQLVHGAVGDVHHSAVDLLDRLDASSAAIIAALRAERVALSEDVRTEREAVLSAADIERKAIALDAARITAGVIKSSGEQVRYLAREILLMLVLLIIIVLALPFAAGYLVGRARRDRAT